MAADMAGFTYLLLSGGIDSAACLQYYLELRRSVRGLFVHYGQAAVTPERKSAQAVSSHYSITLDQVIVSPPRTFSKGEIRGRNAFLILTALLYCPTETRIIASGIHSGTPYYDCSESFLESMNDILDGYSNGGIRCEAPFLHWEKSAIWEYCLLKNVPVHITYSCEAGTEPPCGQCLSCLDKRALHARAL